MMPQALRALRAQLRLSLASALQYRANYFLVVMSVAIGAGVEVALWRLVLRDRGQVQGFGLDELMIYLVVASITSMISVNWENVLTFSEEVRSGRIARHLIKPMPLFHVTTADWLADKIPVLLGALPVFWGLSVFWPVIFGPGVREILLFALGSLVSLWLSAEIYFLITISAFWIAENAGIAIAFNVLRWAFVGSAFPLSFYPKWVVDILDATPMPYLVYYPTLILMGRVPARVFILKMMVALAMGAVLTILRRLAWRAAEHRLQTVGG